MTTPAERPAPGYDAPEGCEFHAEPNDDWRLVTGKRCRRTVAGHRVCGQPSVAELNRGRIVSYARSDLRTRDAWWAYCAGHLYGNWIEGGQVWHWALRAIKAQP